MFKSSGEPWLRRTIIIALCIFNAAVAIGAEQTAPHLNFPTRGFRLTGQGPIGWQQARGTKGKTVVQWLSPDSTPTKMHAMITIEAAKGTLSTAEETAKAFAKEWGGTVSSKNVLLDGKPAIKVIANNNTESLKPIVAIVVIHDGYLYLVMGGVTKGHECEKQVDEIATQWKWEKTVPPWEHLEFWPQPLRVLNEQLTINYPRDMYEHDTEHADRVLELALYDMRKNNSPFQAYVQLMPVPADIETFKISFLDNLNARKLYEEPLVWHSSKEHSERVVTASARMSKRGEMPKTPVYLKWAMIPLSREKVALINFTIIPENAQDKARYEETADSIVDSIISVPAAIRPESE